jgi:hypothetical protein
VPAMMPAAAAPVAKVRREMPRRDECLLVISILPGPPSASLHFWRRSYLIGGGRVTLAGLPAFLIMIVANDN